MEKKFENLCRPSFFLPGFLNLIWFLQTFRGKLSVHLGNSGVKVLKQYRQLFLASTQFPNWGWLSWDYIPEYDNF